MDAIATKMHNPQSEWLTLSEVAEWLGVHPSTVRNWADKGHLPSHRTQGGHRRFRRNELDLWSKSQRANASKEEAAQVVQTRTRLYAFPNQRRPPSQPGLVCKVG